MFEVKNFSHPLCLASCIQTRRFSKEEYEWLQQSTFNFPGKEELKRMFEEAGFINVRVRSFTGGVAAMHLGYKEKDNTKGD